MAELIHKKQPGAAFLTYIQQHTDGIMSESNTAVGRPLPLWSYSASDNVNRARNSEPDKMAINLCMSFVDFPWRFVTVPPAEIKLRLYQAMAHGGPVALNMHGTMDQEDQQALIAARPIFQWHTLHQDLYVGQRNVARVLLLRGNQNAYRGFFRLLSEQHIPFVVSDHLKWSDSTRRFDWIAPDGAPENWIITFARWPPLRPARPAQTERWKGRHASLSRGYWRIHDHTFFPSLRNTKLLFPTASSSNWRR